MDFATRYSSHFQYVGKPPNFIKNVIKKKTFADKYTLFDVFLHKLFMKVRSECVVYKCYLFFIFFVLCTVFKYHIIIPSAI